MVLGVAKSTVYKMMADGDLPFVKVGRGSKRIRPSTLEKWIAEREEHPAEASA